MKYNPKKSFDVYIDKNPKDIKYTHKRIWQVGMIMNVRLNESEKYKLSFNV